ncbi:MAG TPA: polysaccharide biosynthesis tyrosine autokinase [Stellaceae bacterium]|nr:polysaccharide biosynthesis tyrosine autokinase [Stellaceae bacterium]
MGRGDFAHPDAGRDLIGYRDQALSPEIAEVPLSAIMSHGQESTLLGLARAVWRHRVVITAVAVLFMVLTGVYVASQRPLYTSEGAIVIASRKIMIPGIEAMETPTGDIAIIRSEMGVLQSRNLLQEVAATLHLDANPEFNPLLRPKDDSLWARLDPRPFLHRLLAPGPARPVDQQAYVAAAVEATLQKHLTLINNEKDYVITIRYVSENPAISAAVVNTLMDKYLAEYSQLKTNAAQEAGSALNARAEQLRRDADQADAAVANFVKNNKFVETPSGSVNAQQLQDLNTQLASARADRAAAEARYRDALNLAHGGGTDTASEVLASPLIQALRTQEAELSRKQAELSQQLGPQHPDLKRVEVQLAQLHRTIQRETGKITASLKGQADITRARETGLEARFNQLQAAAVAGNAAFTQFQQLKAEADSKRQIYAGFLSKLAEAAKPGERQPIDARIISPAVAPIDPANARGLFFIVIAGVIGGLVAVAGSLTYDQLDRGFATLDQVRKETGLPAFAAIPPLRGRWRWSKSGRYVVDHPYSATAETLRGVRARLRWTGDAQKVLLVSSAQPGEGKTSFALALAQVTAADGWRTLLIEGDARSPILAKVLSSNPSAEPAEVLSGTTPWQDRIGRDELTGLYYFVAAGRGNGFPARLEQQFDAKPIEQMRAAFDYIIIDSPPVMRVADATVFARFADIVVLVVAAKRTRRRAVAEALRRLFMAAKPVGIVLTNTSEQPSEEDIYAGYGRRAQRGWAVLSSRIQAG